MEKTQGSGRLEIPRTPRSVRFVDQPEVLIGDNIGQFSKRTVSTEKKKTPKPFNSTENRRPSLSLVDRSSSRLFIPRDLLDCAIYEGDIGEVLRLVVEDIDIKDGDAPEIQSPFHIAVIGGHEGVVRSLLNLGVDVNSKTNKGRTALHIAVQEGNAKIVILLLEYGADISVTDGEGQNALDMAIETENAEIVDILKNSKIYAQTNKENDAP